MEKERSKKSGIYWELRRTPLVPLQDIPLAISNEAPLLKDPTTS